MKGITDLLQGQLPAGQLGEPPSAAPFPTFEHFICTAGSWKHATDWAFEALTALLTEESLPQPTEHVFVICKASLIIAAIFPP